MTENEVRQGTPGVPATSRERVDLPKGSAFGAYRIRRRLGRGGMGAVYEAEQVADGRIVALKVLHTDLDQLNARDRFLREGRCAAAVNHPNTVYVYRTEEIDGRPTICMELVSDETLDDRVQTRGPLPVSEVVEFALQMIDGLAAAHDVGLLHRDIKPANCFVAADGTLKVGDFGLSKPVNAEDQLRLTQTGVFLGTPVFSSPEQLLGEALDVRSDIYAVGLTLYYALTGKLPFASGSMMQVVASVVNGAPTPVTVHRPDLAPAVAQVVMRAMARKVADRYQNYDEFRDAVARLRAEVVVPAPVRDRLRAWFADGVLFVLSFSALALALMLLQWAGVVPATAESDGPNFVETVSYLLIALVLVALPEGLRGASPGKWLVGIRVVGPDGRPPGIARAALRTVLIWSCYPVYDATHVLAGSEGAAAIAMVLARLVLLSTARRANGWVTVYDRLTRTRVVRAAVAPLRRRRAKAPSPMPRDVDLSTRIGPYIIVREGNAADGCEAGWDPALQRHLWIATAADGEPVPEVRRAVTRATRVRWLDSGGDAAARWNAWAAPGGEPFLRRIERPIRWDDVQGWVGDLSDELVAAEADGTLPVVPPVDSLWVGANDVLLVADAFSPRTAGSPARSPQDLIAELVTHVRSSGQVPPGLPLFATNALDAVRTAPHARAARDAITATARRPVAVSSRVRTWMLVAQLAPFLLLPLALAKTFELRASADRAGAQVDALLSYMGRDTTNGSRSDEAGRSVGSYLRRRGFAGASRARSAEERDSLSRNRTLAAVYIASALADRARDTTLSPNVLSPSKQARALAVAREHASASEADVRAARILVDSVWRGIPPGANVTVRLWGPGILLAVLLGVFFTGGTLVSALLFRRGVFMRLFGVELVTANGRRAGRGRVLLRQAGVCVPAAITCGVLGILLFLALLEGTTPRLNIPVVASVSLAWAVYVWHAARWPARSVADRIAGTYLVPS